MQAQVQAFVEAMTEFGLYPVVEAELVICRFTPLDGARANCIVEVGVSIGELENWPQMPPHWIHLPAEIGFAETNIRTSSKSGWLMHSRGCPGWGDSPQARHWIGHLQTVLGKAIK